MAVAWRGVLHACGDGLARMLAYVHCSRAGAVGVGGAGRYAAGRSDRIGVVPTEYRNA